VPSRFGPRHDSVVFGHGQPCAFFGGSLGTSSGNSLSITARISSEMTSVMYATYCTMKRIQGVAGPFSRGFPDRRTKLGVHSLTLRALQIPYPSMS
jgi:hypothetical protein